MAAVTPRKRNRSSADDLSLAFETPVKKLVMGFAQGPSPPKKSRNNWIPSQIKRSSNLKANEAAPMKPAPSRRLDISPLQAARAPTAAQTDPLGKLSPKPASSYKPCVPVGSFYGKEKRYLTLMERKELRENHASGERNGGENLPAASRTEKRNGSSSRKTSSKATKPAENPKPGKTAPKTLKKAKGEIPAAKPSVGKENVNCLIQKKMDSPFRVLSMTVKPALKLQLGAAFFCARKKSHSKKPAGDTSSLPKSLQENDEPGPSAAAKPDSTDGNKILDASLVLSGIAGPQKKENETEEGDTSSPPSSAGVYPIFSAPPASKKRTQATLDELTSPFGSSPPAKPPHALQKSKKAKELCKRSRDQMIIDAGQKHFGAVVCKSCGMIYMAASPEDEAQHLQHHERFLETLQYVGWKKERVVAEFWDGKIVLILPDDPKYAVKKAEDVREIVDNELGFNQVSLRCPAKTKIYLFVSNEKIIVGCLVAESIKQAFRVLSEPGAAPSPGQDVLQPQRAWCCSTEPEPAVCGVSRIWVFGPSRRKGIARRMVDVVRSTFMYGCYLGTHEIAFSDPTPDGKSFAAKYCQTPNFLVYNFVYSN
ncbi:PREDICTED: N-acetyltransferase ESCO2 [Apaloderma vittatum]|uniref:N-acetyltransferase ESCO2 n=1 Tax=Apaloderma vittatum TaxID=57397 RepID=UPI0005218D63|nr:PREDICTED: N-acetyltransferase ESCO2 [Apaloderma vittatum]